jgi:hypothetical protein
VFKKYRVQEINLSDNPICKDGMIDLTRSLIG